MKRYICIIIIVTGALLAAEKGSWNISHNAITVNINAAGK